MSKPKPKRAPQTIVIRPNQRLYERIERCRDELAPTIGNRPSLASTCRMLIVLGLNRRMGRVSP